MHGLGMQKHQFEKQERHSDGFGLRRVKEHRQFRKISSKKCWVNLYIVEPVHC